MRVKVRLFAVLREAAGKDELDLEFSGAETVAAAMEQIYRQVPALQRYEAIVTPAVNGEYASPEDTLRDGDELALIPPIAGGNHD